MIAMQYSFTLPADYDMTIIERRIREKGPLLDGYPHLRFKAWLSARKESNTYPSRENLYAPFYLWVQPEGISNFLASPIFQSLAGNFGRPAVRTWIIWHSEISDDVTKAHFASRQTTSIAPYADLAGLRALSLEQAKAAIAGGAIAALDGFEPTTWSMVHFRLWRTAPLPDEATQYYDVGHVSLGQISQM